MWNAQFEKLLSQDWSERPDLKSALRRSHRRQSEDLRSDIPSSLRDEGKAAAFSYPQFRLFLSEANNTCVLSTRTLDRSVGGNLISYMRLPTVMHRTRTQALVLHVSASLWSILSRLVCTHGVFVVCVHVCAHSCGHVRKCSFICFFIFYFVTGSKAMSWLIWIHGLSTSSGVFISFLLPKLLVKVWATILALDNNLGSEHLNRVLHICPTSNLPTETSTQP